MVLLIKQCGHVYMRVIFIITFYVCLYGRFIVKLFFFRIYNCVCKFDENKNKNLLKKKRKTENDCHYRTNSVELKGRIF